MWEISGMKFLEFHRRGKGGLQRLRNAFLREGPIPRKNNGNNAAKQHHTGKPEQHDLLDVHRAAHHFRLCFLD
jgi:hypothetical protein